MYACFICFTPEIKTFSTLLLLFVISICNAGNEIEMVYKHMINGVVMKKIALLFTILCAGQLYGMESERSMYGMEKMGAFGELPKDIHHEIVKKAIESSKNLEDVIQAINVACAIHGACYDNLKDFTKLVHILADKFDKYTIFGVIKFLSTEIIAEEFGTQIAKQYTELNNELLKMTQESSWNPNRAEVINKLEELIKAGADVNYLPAYSRNVKVGKRIMNIPTSPMHNAMVGGNLDVVTLLLNSGVKLESDEYYDTYDFWPHNMRIKQAMKQLLDEARARSQKK